MRQSRARGAPYRNAAPRYRYRRAMLVCLSIGIGAALIMNGSTAEPYRQIAFLTLAVVLLLCVGVRVRQPETRRLAGWTLGCLGLFLLWSFIQTLPMPAGWPAHPVWTELAQLGLEVDAHISIVPAQTIASLPAVILPVLVFVAFLVLCQERREALLAWNLLAALGLSLAGLAVVLELLFPDVLFFSPVPVGSGAFTGFLRNRNIAAAFLGLVACAVAALLLLPKRKRESQKRHPAASASAGLPTPERFALSALLFLLVIALILTRSRAGVSMALAALTLAFVLYFILQPSQHARGTRPLRPVHKATLAVLAVGAVVLAFGEPVLSRLGMEVEDARWCAYASTWQAIRERPFTGAGFGTFAEMFPRYRDPECLGTSGSWIRAHNSYLELLAGSGLLGVMLFTAALVRVGHVLVTGIRTRRSLRAIPVLTAGAAVFAMLHSAVDFPLQIPGIALYFSALLGTGCAVSMLSRSAESRGTSRRSGSARRRRTTATDSPPEPG